MSEEVKASIIILCHDGLAYMDGCLRSLLDQTYPRERYEVIVADNASEDESVSFVSEKYPSVKLIEFERNYGFAEGNNRAVHLANGEYLVFLNQDTVVHRKWLSELVLCLDQKAGLAACHCNILSPRSREYNPENREEWPKVVCYYEMTKYGYAEERITSFRHSIIRANFLSGAAFIIRKSVIKEIGYLFDGSFGSYNEDMDLAMRLRSRGYKIGVIPTAVVYHHSSFSTTITRRNLWKHFMIIRNRFLSFYKSLGIFGFVLFLPTLVISHSKKTIDRSKRIGFSCTRAHILGLLFLPLTFVGLVAALEKIIISRSYTGNGIN
jgi:GT2 family glycosyltransferase